MTGNYFENNFYRRIDMWKFIKSSVILLILLIPQVNTADTLYIVIPPFNARVVGFKVVSFEVNKFHNDLKRQMKKLFNPLHEDLHFIYLDSVEYYHSLKVPITVFSINNYFEQTLQVNSKLGYLNASLYLYKGKSDYAKADMYCSGLVRGEVAAGNYTAFSKALKKAFAEMSKKFKNSTFETQPIPLCDAMDYDPIKYCQYHDFFVGLKYDTNNIGYEPTEMEEIQFNKFFTALIGVLMSKDIRVIKREDISTLNDCNAKLYLIDFGVSKKSFGFMNFMIVSSDEPEKILFKKEAKITMKNDWHTNMDFYDDMKKLFTIIRSDYIRENRF